jgi:transcriptional regulator with AAA-type ATPase domain
LENVLTSLLDKAVETRLNVVLVGEAGVGKERGARLLHTLRQGTVFYKYDYLTDEAGRWNLLDGFLSKIRHRLLQPFKENETYFLKDIHLLDARQVEYLADFFHRQVINQEVTSSILLRTGLVCSCALLREQDSPLREFIIQFFPLEITIPSLRERQDEMEGLASDIIHEYCGALNRDVPEIEPEALLALKNYGWPGNVSELRSVLTEACTLTNSHNRLTADVIEKRLIRNRSLTACNEQQKT